MSHILMEVLALAENVSGRKALASRQYLTVNLQQTAKNLFYP
jgi:hypothetical protein